MYTLVFEIEGRSEQYELKDKSVQIGRALDNNIVIPDISVSRHHARIDFQDGKWVIKDLGSRNGIRVGDRFVTQHVLHDDDEIWLGNVCIRVVAKTDHRIKMRGEDFEVDTEIPKGTIIQRVDEIQLEEEKPEIEEGVPAPPRGIFNAIVDVAKRLIQFHNLEELLNRIMDLVFEYTPAERGFLMLYDPSINELVPKVVRYRHGDESVITISRSITNYVFQERASILTLDAQTDERFSGGESIIMHGIRSVMCVPLWTREATLGVVFVDSTTRAVQFTNDHLQLLTLLAHFSAAAVQQAQLLKKIQNEMAIRERLLRYHSPEVAEQLLASTDSGGLMLEPAELEVSVLFADMVGFSSRAEQMSPKRVAALLNDFFSELVDVIFKYQGTLDKFIGDAVMAFFGAPKPKEHHALMAVLAAHDMLEKIREFNASRGINPPVHVRVGINSGNVVAGDIGSPRRMEYTVLGNTVNIAARLEAFVAQPNEIVIGEGTYEKVKDYVQCEDLGFLDLKGIRKKVRAYRIIGIEKEAYGVVKRELEG